MRRTSGLMLWTAALLAAASFASFGRDDREAKSAPARDEPANADESASALAMSPAVACVSIKGFEDYEPLPGAALTSHEKLVVYYRPLHYRVERDGKLEHIHLVQDGQIRRRGKKAVLLSKAKMVDYEWKGRPQNWQVYLKSEVSLKGLEPGEYEFDIILHDRLAPGEPVARQSLTFRVIPPSTP